MAKPAVHEGSLHDCSRRKGGPVAQVAQNKVYICGKLAATAGDLLKCVDTAERISFGSPAVAIMGRAAAREEDPTNKDGKMKQGTVRSTVLIGDGLPPKTIKEKILWFARLTLGSKLWALDAERGTSLAGDPKCNMHVAEILEAADLVVPWIRDVNVRHAIGQYLVIVLNHGLFVGSQDPEFEGVAWKYSGRLALQLDGRRPPTVEEWSKGQAHVGHWTRQSAEYDPQLGDIIIHNAIIDGVDNWHIGIVSRPGMTISAASKPELNRVVENDWGFRKEQLETRIVLTYEEPQ